MAFPSISVHLANENKSACEKSLEFLFANVIFDVCFESFSGTWA